MAAKHPLPEINVTPLVDVVLVLLIIFMVVTPMMQRGQPVELPHCFNAHDGVDPDAHYYQGPGWYRARLKVENPYADGRTLLHFEGEPAAGRPAGGVRSA